MEVYGPWTRRSDSAEERAAVVIRAAVVAAVGLALVIGPELARGRPGVVWTIVAGTALYAAALLVTEWAERPLPVRPAVLTVIDGLLVLVACGLTGGADSIFVAVLPLIAIAMSLRAGPVVGRLGALGVGLGFTVACVVGSDADVPPAERLLTGAWWSGFLVAAAVLVGVLARMLERQLVVAAESRARAVAEHEKLVSERELRARLVAAQRARLDGVRVVLHEFRTPVASLTALTADLAAGKLSPSAADSAIRLLAEHAVHLRDMLEGLADLAVRDGSPLGRVTDRPVVLAELAEAVLDAAAVAPARRRITVEPAGAVVRCDPQRLRRVLTNLAENAARHSGDAPVELALSHVDGILTAQVRDRGPGLPPGQEGVVTSKGVAIGERRGTAGLGLWIVEALVGAMNGELELRPRAGGGLVAHLTLPLDPA
ncbi:sensor histidine kinase KdpD [Pseudonocardia sp. WMMC193]|uniref:sensor histidine kinase n=1 Tax=Pseudonocardia sp. WMMC193 TaxID=2911965 RepID=UPI001F172B43|nr:HAMP domain-containing sensor histidine kinase [Pseudonocardia sp. WMMC193]MCF7553085.1 HAMP domain-containing histidine kinase [Pseudonocardia sp. WMMC193]